MAGGTVRVLVDSAGSLAGSGQTLAALRAALDRWGSLAPVVYVAAVRIEAPVASVRATIRYGPAGARLGGLLGGTLSLIGNTIDAAIACGVGSALGEGALARRIDGTKLTAYRAAIQER